MKEVVRGGFCSQMNIPSTLRIHLWIFPLFLGMSFTTPLYGQQSSIRGFVTDESDGRPMPFVNVIVEAEDGTVRGAVTNNDGLYVITRLPQGEYVLRATFVGYAVHEETLLLREAQRLARNIVLVPAEVSPGEVVVQAERTHGAARVTAGMQTVTPAEIQLVPGPDVSGDLATYLTTLPGVITAGDRGGQVFIRGGEPTQNLVLLDGMLVYQPFHILGFYSAFPTEIIGRADIHAGGFGSRFGERISSVIDISSRVGNMRRFQGSFSAAPFVSSAMIEGPIWPDRLSFIGSARQSIIEHGASRIVDTPMPFEFGDFFGKIHGEVLPNSRTSVSGLRTHDRGTIEEATAERPAEELRWENQAIGLRHVALPSILPIMTTLQLSYSRLESEQGPPGEPSRTSLVNSIFASVDATFYSENVDFEAGLSLRGHNLWSDLGGLYQNIEMRRSSVDHIGQYLEANWRVAPNMRLRPGLRMQFYNTRIDPFLEPRLRFVWNLDIHEISGAGGMYQQEVVGLSDRRDAASVFTAWSHIPRPELRDDDVRAGRIPRAWHLILGYRVTPSPVFEFSIEGFYKHLSNLFVAEWTAFPRFTTRLQPAQGRSAGVELRAEVRGRWFYGYLNYGLSATDYWAEQVALQLWYGVERLHFRPPHDRRHQVNALVSVSVLGFDVSARWHFGSGLPFSRALGFDGFAIVDDIFDISRRPSSRRVIYERPFNGLLPTYHRLDLSLERAFNLRLVDVTVHGSLINAYDRANIFYLDVFTLHRVDQLPLVPSFGLKVSF